jgi:polysaccharide export outer membrane protein
MARPYSPTYGFSHAAPDATNKPTFGQDAKMNRFQLGFLCSVLLLAGSACTSSVTANPPQMSASTASAGSPEASGGQFGDSDSAALEQLWKARLLDPANSRSSGSFVLAPGDLLRISVPPIEQHTVRVSEGNTIALPLLGEINVAGMTEKDLREALTARMAKYRYHPQVAVFLEQAEDRQVAVLGAVKVPGRYMLASPSDTMMTAISRAGGITEGAASRVFLIPAKSSPMNKAAAAQPAITLASLGTNGIDPGQHVGNAATGPSSGSDQIPPGSGDDPLVIDISRPTGQRYLEIPARPGDVVLVPLAGEVTVQGWVDKPGSFKVTPDMTVLNAIASAGGPKFSSSATLLREKPGGSKQVIALDLSRMKAGEQPDPPVEGGDVVVVERSVLGAVPYSLSYLIQRVGFGVPLF